MRVTHATGVLAVFAEAGVLAAADVHVARRLGELARESNELVLLATALAVRAVRLGATCLELERMHDVNVDEDRPGGGAGPPPARAGRTQAGPGGPGQGGAGLGGAGLGDPALHAPVDVAGLPWPAQADVVAALRRSSLVVGAAHGSLRPLHLADTDGGPLLYLARYWTQEQSVRQRLADRAATRPPVDVEGLRAALARLFGDAPAPDRQRVAAALAATQWTTVLAGGPGTGKTTTVARVLALLSRPGLRVALAAPTGKAAARLQESVAEQAARLGLPADLPAMTLHRLLGWRPDSRTRFRHDARHHLPYDLVVVDESSMVSLTMMARLLEAVRPDARLLLVGDPDQLTSVDAGAVLADLVARPVSGRADPVLEQLVGPDLSASDDPQEARLSDRERDRLRGGIVRLSRGRRFGGTIAALAVAVREGHVERALDLLRRGAADVSFVEDGDVTVVRDDVVTASREVTAAAEAGDVAVALSRLERHRVLCAHRHGPAGVAQWGALALDWASTGLGRLLDPARWYPGQPLLVTQNDHDAKVYNGDTGVVVQRDDGSLVAAFGRGSAPVLLHPGRLGAVTTVYAMTIHRSQGSQYDTVTVVLPATASSLLTRELLYTAITRARTHVRVLGTEESVRAGVSRQVLRASGLRRLVAP